MRSKIIPHFSSVSAVFHTRMASHVRGRLRAWLLAETYALPLDLFRILGGLLCVAYFVTLLLQAKDFSNPDGLLDHVLLQRILWFTRLGLFQPGITLACLYALLGLACVGAWGIVLGYRVRLCAGVLFITPPSSTAFSAVWRNASVGSRRYPRRSRPGHVCSGFVRIMWR